MQISAVTTGVTQVDLVGADDSVYTIEVMVLGDVRELEAILRQSVSWDPLGNHYALFKRVASSAVM